MLQSVAAVIHRDTDVPGLASSGLATSPGSCRTMHRARGEVIRDPKRLPVEIEAELEEPAVE